MKKTAKPVSRPLDKALFEAGLQCRKRLYLDFHGEGGEADLPGMRRALSATGQRLFALACRAFAKGSEVQSQGEEAVRETAALLAVPAPAVFRGAFRHDRVEARIDILLRNKDESFDVYEVKSGTKVKPRYLMDLALQLHVLEGTGRKVRKANLLHVNPRYRHREGTEIPVQQIFRSVDVTEKARRLVPRVAELLEQFRRQADDERSVEVPVGTWCTNPFPCAYLDRCTAEAPDHPLRELPELTHEQETALHAEGIGSIARLDPSRPGLTARQRRAVECVRQGQPLVEPFVREELANVEFPVHCLAIGSVVEVLPRFTGQRPWRQIPYAWACHSLHQDGKVEPASWVSLERDDPRRPCISALAAHLRSKGTVLSFGHEPYDLARSLLSDLQDDKPGVRAVLARRHLDVGRLLETGVFHPELRGRTTIEAMAETLLGDDERQRLSIADEDQALAAVERAQAPRVRAATREKLGAELLAWLQWRSRVVLELFRKYGR